MAVERYPPGRVWKGDFVDIPKGQERENGHRGRWDEGAVRNGRRDIHLEGRGRGISWISPRGRKRKIALECTGMGVWSRTGGEISTWMDVEG